MRTEPVCLSHSRQTYLLDGATGQYDILDSALSNEYNNTYHSHTVGLNYRVVGKKYNLTAGSGVQFGEQNSVNQSKGYTIDNKYTNLTPTANFTYNFTKTKSLRLFYTGRTGQPSVSQLQPLTTTSDSINFSTGNTRLKQQFTHSFRLLYHSFDVVTQQAMFITINASAITNDIQNSTVYLKTIDPTVTNPLAQITMPVNLNGTYNVAGTFMYSFPLRKPKSNLTFTTNVNYGQSQNLLNDTSNYTRNTKVGETIGWTTNLKDNFDMNFFSTTGYNYGSQTLNKGSNTSTYNETLSTEATYYTHSGWIVASDFSYNINWGLSAGYNTSYPVWNASFSKQVMKNKAGEIKLYVFDLLNKNANVSHTVNGPTTTDSRNMVLPRYFMLSFTYNLRRFGATGNQQRMPGLFRGNRDGGNGGFGGGFGGGGRGRGPL
ncbi:outer membrane protein beta-barrel family-domain-containing protein [Russula earlei]|uniref:Outer membrane protein beta-barrel family-domain-containing protein n=1 Tax=Russula earlei TaxID=71964 RepID=A0ACC0TTR7_9AGAM|nr:outer membrane protein beta-barrel family-domain-containing protein [Russula earlei]